MKEATIAARYVRAFLSITGVAPEKTSQYLFSFAALERLFVQKIISRFFSCPVVRIQEKKEVLELFFQEAVVGSEVQNFLLAILDADRAPLLPFLHTVYQEELQKKLQIVPVRIVSAFPLSDTQKQESAQQLQSVMTRKSQIYFETDASLLGGIIVFVGQLKVDLSLQNKIKQVVNSVRA